VVIIPDGALHNLNFEMLPLYDGERPRYLIEETIVSVAPSIPVRALPRLKVPGSLLLVGDPDRVDPEFPKLRYAVAEIESIAGRFPRQVKVLRGANATPAAFLESGPATFSAIHFAAHASANRESPLDSALILSGDGVRHKLYARDLLKSRLAAGLVTISACRGAGARTYSGEGLVGFAWALLHAGARNVIAGLWDVNDRSTAELMDQVYAGLASGSEPAVALREAKLRLIRAAGNDRKPYYWGPFQHYVASR
jgi:CHAT domain-containing protein